MTHLTPDELIDAAEGTLDPDRRAHLESCELCQREVANLAATLSETRGLHVPEPSPLFWQHFSKRVREAIDAEPAFVASWRGWLRWQVVVPVGATALVAVALITTVPREAVGPPTLAVEERVEPPASDDNWVLVADLVGDVDWDTARAAGLTVEPGDAERAVLELSADEQVELTRLLKAELMRTKS